jgi:three-Cys-motif partner protein
MLFPEPMFVRFLRTNGGEVEPDHERRITDMYGTDEWFHIYRARLDGRLTPAEARTEYVNLMRWRPQAVLGYTWTHTLEVHNEPGRPIYHLIFATDHDAGDRIMRHLYSRALNKCPNMRRQAIDQRRGALRLFDDAESRDQPEEYRYEPPWPPFDGY